MGFTMTSQYLETEFFSDVLRLPAVSAWSRVGAVATAAARLVRLWADRAQGRRALRHLDDHLLKDIGLTRGQALREAGKPFWER